MFSKFNEEVRKILINAKKEMKSLKHPYIGTEHLILSILRKDNLVSSRLKYYNITYDNFKDEVVKSIGIGTKENEWFIYTPLLKKVIENAVIISKEKNLKEVSLECIFLSLLDEGEGIAIRILLTMGLDVDELYDEMNSFRNIKKNNNKLLVDDFGVNLNKKVIDNEIDPVVGRDDEVNRVIEILCRRTKNNPLLIGDAGVGKTAIVEELSRRIVSGEVPSKLSNKRIISVSMASLVSGTKYRGEFEERITKMIKELENCNDAIIFIDEIHTLVGAGGAEGAIDASNILKPALSRGKVNIIGATTTFEYKKFIEDDKALCRRFQNVIINEPSSDRVFDILKKLKPIYEDYHHVSIKEESLRLIVSLCDKYLYNRKQPDKSIDILDEVCSKTSIMEDSISKRTSYYKNLLKTIRELKNDSIINNRFNEAIYLKEEESKLESCINKLDVKIMKSSKRKEVSDDMIADVIKLKSSIPVYELTDSKNIIDDLKQNLSSIVIGQYEAIDIICRYTKKIIMGLKVDKKPLSFLFLGPTGVGKTLLAKEYNKIMFGENNLIRVDMSEYKEEHSISKILGSPPGYVGYENKCTLLEEIKDKPHSVLLLDEIEKAHPSILNLFLQILDEGKIKDSSGNIYRFDNNIIIMTSNIGASFNTVGFLNDTKNSIIDEVKKFFSVEFINRISEIILFNRIDKETIEKITINMIDKFSEKFRFKFNVDACIISDIIKESEYEIFGARKLEKIVTSKIEDYMFDKIDSKV